MAIVSQARVPGNLVCSSTGCEETRIACQAPESEALRLLDTLRDAVTAGGLDLDAQLHEITETAQKLTDASAAALAVRSHGVVICRARVGETAPAIGAKVDVDSGISGECLRTGKALRCEDTSRDLRVDAEVCRQLGLRSLAVVPLRRRRGVAGVLEVFSAQPHVFTDRHMDLLGQLAEMAETVSAGHRNRGNRALRHLYYQLLSIKPTPKSVLQIGYKQTVIRPCVRIRLRFPISSLADITQFRLRSSAFLCLPHS